MLKKYEFDLKIRTGAAVKHIPATGETLRRFSLDDGVFSMTLNNDARVFGLGETVRGINKRGWVYQSFNADDPLHTEDKTSLYGAHNVILVDSGKDDRFLAFFDCPSKITFDIGFSDPKKLTVTPEVFSLDLYIIEGETLKEIAKEFRALIGKSYVPPFWAFGFGQSRWSYAEESAVRRIADRCKESGIPLDMIYLDIDYMDEFCDFTFDKTRFPDFEKLVSEMKARGIRLIPIIDAAVKKEDGYPVFDEGKENGYFCKDKDGEIFVVGVWPGNSALPDFLNEDASTWFGEQYRVLTDLGIEGFWNDMNEPALFYSKKRLDKAFETIKDYAKKELSAFKFFEARNVFSDLSNSEDDFRDFYHDTPDGVFSHQEVHNLYGAFMTRSASNALKTLCPDHLLFSRASYIGAHRYGGLWTGDNHSWFSHILLSLQQMAGLNLCGFLFSGSDIGGFNGSCSEELLLRWFALGIFTPLMRDHSAFGTRDQEPFAFFDTESFRHIITLRYRLLPYLYRSFLDAVEHDGMYFRPLIFDFEDDERAKDVEDQMMVGDSLMIAPVYTQNAKGRYVYLPENMKMARMNHGEISLKELKKGDHYISVLPNEVVFFIRDGHQIPLAVPANNTAEIDMENVTYLG